MFTSGADIAEVNSTAASILSHHEGRQQQRTHLFVAATLYADTGSTPVNIRNMSQSGALIEGSVLPDVGKRITLKRGRLQVAASIAWRVERKAGVRLESAVHVSDWMARQLSSAQERVDAMLSIARDDPLSASATAANGLGRDSIETELGQLRVELIELEHALTADVIVVATHPEIQTLDISVQRIDRILKGLCSGG